MQNENELIENCLINMSNPFAMEDVYKESGLQKTEKRDRELSFIIKEGDQFVAEDDSIYPKEYVLKDIHVRILPTEFEIKGNILILGHRIIPFQPAFEIVNVVSLVYEDKKVIHFSDQPVDKLNLLPGYG